MLMCYIISLIFTSPTLDGPAVTRVAEPHHDLSDTRLVEQAPNVGTLAQLVGISEYAVSHHLREQHQIELVQTSLGGKNTHYRVEDEHNTILLPARREARAG
jgi:hypothetical protein